MSWAWKPAIKIIIIIIFKIPMSAKQNFLYRNKIDQMSTKDTNKSTVYLDNTMCTDEQQEQQEFTM